MSLCVLLLLLLAGVLIPGDVCSIASVQSSARFILVVEKDTIFQRVLREGALDRLGPCIIVTVTGRPEYGHGQSFYQSLVLCSSLPIQFCYCCCLRKGKGYPDVSTRVLLARLEAELRVPMLALVDADPHGIHIMCVYRFGTKVCVLPNHK